MCMNAVWGVTANNADERCVSTARSSRSSTRQTATTICCIGSPSGLNAVSATGPRCRPAGPPRLRPTSATRPCHRADCAPSTRCCTPGNCVETVVPRRKNIVQCGYCYRRRDVAWSACVCVLVWHTSRAKTVEPIVMEFEEQARVCSRTRVHTGAIWRIR